MSWEFLLWIHFPILNTYRLVGDTDSEIMKAVFATGSQLLAGQIALGSVSQSS